MRISPTQTLLVLFAAGVILSACAPETINTTEPPPAETTAARPVGGAGQDGEDAASLTLEQFNADYSALLGRVVSPQRGLVNYTQLVTMKGELDRLAAAVAQPREFASEGHRLAFLINAHNLLVLKSVVDVYPIGSIRDVRGFMSRPMPVLGRNLSLEQVRDQLIRPLGEPRAHMALCIACLGSPPLLHTAYTAELLDDQLNAQATRFVNSRTNTFALAGQLMVSEMFQWFAADFRRPPFTGVADFLRLYAAPGSPAAGALANPDVTIEYLEYNWALNAAR